MRSFLFTAAFLAVANIGLSQKMASLSIYKTDSVIVSRHIYGQFSEHLGRGIYDGIWVDPKLNVPKKGRIRMDVVDALKKIKIPNLRWPGGCFADEYHWRDGIGPRENRPTMINTNWGGVTEDNSFGTHEFLELCDLIGCEPYVSANVGSGTVEEMSKWVEYLNFDGKSPMTDLRTQNGHPAPYKVSFWGVGNEAWGCGGNMTADYYANQFKRYSSFAKNYPNAPLKRIASGPSDDDYNWTEVCMKNISSSQMWGLSLHHYTLPTGKWSDKGSATQFSEAEYFNTMKNCIMMEELVTKHSAIMDKYDSKKKVALAVDEWGIWTNVEPGTNPGYLFQQNSLRDALVAATTLNIFINHCDRVRLANMAQTVNVLQSLILTQKEKMVLTPTYHVFDLYKVHQDAKHLPLKMISPGYNLNGSQLDALNVSASQDAAGSIHITLVNIDYANAITIKTDLNDQHWNTVTGQILTSTKLTDINTFDKPDAIKPVNFAGATKDNSMLNVTIPAHSVVMLEIK